MYFVSIILTLITLLISILANTILIMHRACTNHPDNSCYVCGLFCVKSQRRTITNQLRKMYKLYFGCPGQVMGTTCDMHFLFKWTT